MNIADLRKDYTNNQLLEETLHASPFEQFQIWLQQAISAQLPEPTAMNLATVQNGRPSSRIVLLKGFDSMGMVFFTNYLSKKGQSLSENPHACLNFFWPELERQVRIEGIVARTSEQESALYFASRPALSRMSAVASPQSQKVADRAALEAFFEASKGEENLKPAHWGGFRLTPNYFEFWQGRPNRLHDRLIYELSQANTWQIARLAP